MSDKTISQTRIMAVDDDTISQTRIMAVDDDADEKTDQIELEVTVRVRTSGGSIATDTVGWSSDPLDARNTLDMRGRYATAKSILASGVALINETLAKGTP